MQRRSLAVAQRHANRPLAPPCAQRRRVVCKSHMVRTVVVGVAGRHEEVTQRTNLGRGRDSRPPPRDRQRVGVPGTQGHCRRLPTVPTSQEPTPSGILHSTCPAPNGRMGRQDSKGLETKNRWTRQPTPMTRVFPETKLARPIPPTPSHSATAALDAGKRNMGKDEYWLETEGAMLARFG